MLKRRTDLAVEATQLWQEQAGETTQLRGVQARDSVREGYKVTTVRILDESGAQALGKPVGTYITVELDGPAAPGGGRVSTAARALAAGAARPAGPEGGGCGAGGGPGQPGHHAGRDRPQGRRLHPGHPPSGRAGPGAVRRVPARVRPGGGGAGHHRHGERGTYFRRGGKDPPGLRAGGGRFGVPEPAPGGADGAALRYRASSPARAWATTVWP